MNTTNWRSAYTSARTKRARVETMLQFMHARDAISQLSAVPEGGVGATDDIAAGEAVRRTAAERKAARTYFALRTAQDQPLPPVLDPFHARPSQAARSTKRPRTTPLGVPSAAPPSPPPPRPASPSVGSAAQPAVVPAPMASPAPQTLIAAAAVDATDDTAAADSVIQLSALAPFAAPGEPACVQCGRYGAYVCDRTDRDVCSIECRDKELAEAEQTVCAMQPTTHPEAPAAPGSPALIPPQSTWNVAKNRWRPVESELSVERCWKCRRAGHLPAHCTAHSRPVVPKDLAALYGRCRELARSAGSASCSTCVRRHNLVHCMDCSRVFCDGSGHLARHLLEQPGHTALFSFKLRKLIKCCNASCNVTNVRQLLACQHCLQSAFDRNYCMYTATWSRRGLSEAMKAVACDAHFDWHRMNCEGHGAALVDDPTLHWMATAPDGTVSEHLF